MAQSFFWKINGGIRGPFSSKELRRMAVAGKLLPDSLIRLDGTDKWIAAGKINNLEFSQPEIALGSESDHKLPPSPKPEQTICTQCGREMGLSPGMVGKKVLCSHCNKSTKVISIKKTETKCPETKEFALGQFVGNGYLESTPELEVFQNLGMETRKNKFSKGEKANISPSTSGGLNVFFGWVACLVVLLVPILWVGNFLVKVNHYREVDKEREHRAKLAEADRRAKEEKNRTILAEAKLQAKEKELRDQLAEANRRAKEKELQDQLAEANRRAKEEEEKKNKQEAEKIAQDNKKLAAELAKKEADERKAKSSSSSTSSSPAPGGVVPNKIGVVRSLRGLWVVKVVQNQNNGVYAVLNAGQAFALVGENSVLPYGAPGLKVVSGDFTFDVNGSITQIIHLNNGFSWVVSPRLGNNPDWLVEVFHTASGRAMSRLLIEIVQ